MLQVAGTAFALSLIAVLLGGWFKLMGCLDTSIGRQMPEDSQWGGAVRTAGKLEVAASPWLLRLGLVGLCSSFVAVLFFD
jgi:hypothetical protein